MLRRSLKYTLVPLLLKWLLSLIVMTCRIKHHDKSKFDELISDQQPFILLLWHECSTIAGWAMRNHPVTVMVSDSRDGEYVARLAQSLGIPTLRGSSSRGAEQALMSAIRLLRKNKPIAITPDGPRGPRHYLQHGCLWLAASTKTPVMHMHILASREWQLNSWDKHRFPKPFSTIHVQFSPLMTINRDELEQDLEAVSQQLSEMIQGNQQTAELKVKN